MEVIVLSEIDKSTKSRYGAHALILSVFTVAAVFFALCYNRKRIGAAVDTLITTATARTQQPTTSNNSNHQYQQWWQKVDPPTMEKFLLELAQENPIRFNAQHLYVFTENYKSLLGSGGFGKVYKGKLPDGLNVAVKVLNRPTGSENKAHLEQQFMAEVGTIGRTHHINLVRLYGFCYDQFMSALVYEYLENGSLDRYLFDEKKKHALDWEKLHEVAVGTAKGIAYLHQECQKRIVHYDIKPGNVLLDSNFAPKVADFGLAKLCNRDDTHVSVTGYRGTPGYSAPEFMLKNFPITYKCDVYSFGILLFEIVGRRRNARSSGGGGEDVSSSSSLGWFPKNVWEEYEKGELVRLLEDCGIEEKDRDEAKRTAMVALWCVQDSPEARPPMSAVVKMLEGGVEIVPPPKPFRYLFSVGTNALLVPAQSGSGSDFTGSEGTNSYWYREKTTPIMAKYEIEIATSTYTKE